jgi:hypothetical protein
MQNLWFTGLVLGTLVGSGAVVRMGAFDNHNSMHERMHDGDYDCRDNNNCQLDHEECQEHTEEYCEEEHGECDHHHTEIYGCC